MIVKNRLAEFLVVLSLIVFSLLWKLIDLPQSVSCYKPDLLLITIMFIMITVPNMISIWSAWFIGLLADALHGFALGSEAIQLAFVALIVNALYHRIIYSTILEKAILVLFISTVTSLIEIAIYKVIFDQFNGCDLYSIISNTLSWPLFFWVFNLLHKFSYKIKK